MTDDLAARFQADGFLVVRDLISPAETAALRDETLRLCREHGETLGGAQADAQAAETADGGDGLAARFLCIHFPHKLSALARATLAHPRIVPVLTKLIGPNVKCMQSMLFIKHAGKPGQAWHQDENFIPTRDRSLTAAWIALDDATVDNGCLWAIPGSHRSGILWPQRQHADPEYDAIPQAFDFPYRDEDARPIEATAGSVVFFQGYLLHKSLRNRRASGFRRALVNHYMSAESLLPWWRAGGPNPPTQDNRDVILVAGVDPYAWKGTQSLNEPYVRRETSETKAY
jgi:ectoine hydroxylase-related dioxygenase (phytanoyl-CoA dioxygenase family)